MSTAVVGCDMIDTSYMSQPEWLSGYIEDVYPLSLLLSGASGALYFYILHLLHCSPPKYNISPFHLFTFCSFVKETPWGISPGLLYPPGDLPVLSVLSGYVCKPIFTCSC